MFVMFILIYIATQAVVCVHAFLHALSDKSVETETSRALQVGGVRIQIEKSPQLYFTIAGVGVVKSHVTV